MESDVYECLVQCSRVPVVVLFYFVTDILFVVLCSDLPDVKTDVLHLDIWSVQSLCCVSLLCICSVVISFLSVLSVAQAIRPKYSVFLSSVAVCIYVLLSVCGFIAYVCISGWFVCLRV